MSCDFAAYRIAASNQVVLVHQPDGATDPGFGAARGTSRATVQVGSGAEQDMVGYLLWLPTVIIAELPANVPAGAATVRVRITTPTTCTSSAVLGDAGTTLPSDLVFAIAIPETALPGQTIDIVNLKPGFAWATRHTPVRLHRLDGSTSFPVTVAGGMGGTRLRLTLPDAATLALPAPVEQFLLSFGTDPQRLALTVAKATDVTTLPEWADLAFPTPSVARPGQSVTLDVAEPPPPVFPSGTKFKFRRADLGDLVLESPPGQRRATIEASGWETDRLTFTVPPADALGLPAGVDVPAVLKFTNRLAPIALTVSVPPLPALAAWLRVGTLTCRDKNESSADEMQLLFTLDGVRQDRIPSPIGEEDYHRFTDVGSYRTYDVWIGPYTQRVDVELREIDDWPDPDDTIEVERLGTAPSGGPSDLVFEGDGTKYTLSHYVSAFPVGQLPSP